jgi:hypothetical protein
MRSSESRLMPIPPKPDRLLHPSIAKTLIKKMNLVYEPIVTCTILPISNDVPTPPDPPNTRKKKERIIRRN